MNRVILASLLAAAATAGAPGLAQAGLNPGDVATEAYTRMDAETFALDPDDRKSDFWRETVPGGASASSSYRWPIPPPTAGSGFTCEADGCAGYSGRAYGHADATGVLKAAASATLYLGNVPNDGYGLAGYIFSDGRAEVADTVTLSKPATVILRGSLSGGFGGSADTDNQPEPRATIEASVSLLGDEWVCDVEWCEQERFGGWSFGERAPIFNCPGDGSCGIAADVPDPTDHPVSETFSVAIDLPAGTSYLLAKLAAAVDFQVYGYTGETDQSSAHVNFANSLDFELEVPSDVVATSGSGLLTIVGGASGDETPPSVFPPPDVTAAAGEACSAGVNAGTATAEDGGVPLPVSGERSDGLALTAAYPLGTTTITWSATDAAGNTGTAAQTVTVVDETDPSLSPPADVTAPNDPGAASAAVDPGSASASDDCGEPAVSGSRSDGAALDAPYPVGTTTITWTATDAAGNSASAAQTVTVDDVEAPALSVPSGIVVDATSPAGAIVSYAVAATDNVGVASQSCAPASASTFGIGDTTVHCSAEDAAGNVTTASFVVHVAGAEEQLAALEASLTQQSLQAKAAAAKASAAAGKTNAACNQLNALLNHVDAQEGKSLTTAEADAIRQAVARIRGVLGC